MKISKVIPSLALTGILLVATTTASATIVANFTADGANDPIAQGWSTFAPVDAGAHVAASGGDPVAWEHQENGSTGGYRILGSHANFQSVTDGAEGWTATIQAKLFNSVRRNAAFLLEDNYSKFELSFWDGSDFGDGNPGAFYHDTSSAYWAGIRLGAAGGTLDATDGFHTYQISLDAGGTDAATSTTDDQISIYVDGTLQVGPLPRSAFPTAGQRELGIGRFEAAGGLSKIQYANFGLESGAIPEPSTLLLLVLGLVGVLGWCRRS